jgi:hypothetical protein
VSARIYPFRNNAAVNGTFWLWGAQLEAGSFATDYIPTAANSVTRAIETCRFSPLVEAIMQRAASSAVVRGQGLQQPVNGRLIGTNTTTTLLQSLSTTTVSANGGAPVATLGSGTMSGTFGVARGDDATGRSVVANGGTVASDSTVAPTRTTIYLGRDATNGAGTYGAGFYDFVGIAPERLANANLQALAVAA